MFYTDLVHLIHTLMKGVLSVFPFYKQRNLKSQWHSHVPRLFDCRALISYYTELGTKGKKFQRNIF